MGQKYAKWMNKFHQAQMVHIQKNHAKKKKKNAGPPELDFFRASYIDHPYAPFYVARDASINALPKIPYEDVHKLPQVRTYIPEAELHWYAYLDPSEAHFIYTHRLTNLGW